MERGAGAGAAILDQAFADAGATLVDDPAEVWAAEIVLKVQRPTEEEMGRLRPGQVMVGMLDPHMSREQVDGYAKAGVAAFAHGAAAAHHPGAGHGRALQPGQPRRLQGDGRRHGGLQPRAADDDDGGRHRHPGQDLHRRCRCRRPAGDRHRPADGGRGLGHRRAPRRQGGDREPGRQVRGLHPGGRRHQGRLCAPAHARGAGRAGADGGRAHQGPGHRRHHRPDPGPQGAADRDGRDGALDEAGLGASSTSRPRPAAMSRAASPARRSRRAGSR